MMQREFAQQSGEETRQPAGRFTRPVQPRDIAPLWELERLVGNHGFLRITGSRFQAQHGMSRSDDCNVHEAKPGIFPLVEEALSSGGRPLEDLTRSYMEARFGQNFSEVRVHCGGGSAASARLLSARAFTVGRDLMFGEGEYSPATLAGRRLIAHELNHVVHQRRSAPSVQARRLRDITGPQEDPATLSNSEIEKTNEYRAYMTSGLVWQEELHMRRPEALQACRDLLTAIRSGKKVSWTSDSRRFARHAIYQQRLADAVQITRNILFGRAENKFDQADWVEERDPDPLHGSMLLLRAGKRPSAAIDNLFAHQDRWGLDCAQYVQVAELYALRYAYGAREFDQRAPEWAPMFGGKVFALRVQWSTGVKWKIRWARDRKSEGLKRIDAATLRTADESREVQEILAAAPIGTRVAFTNEAVPATNPYKNENTLKMGNNQYAAHGFGGKKMFSASEIMWEMAKHVKEAPDTDYVQRNIFVSRIEIYETP